VKIRREEEDAKQMAEAPSKIESMRRWVVQHKLRAVGNASSISCGFVFLPPDL
jgi:hypothetical protein